MKQDGPKEIVIPEQRFMSCYGCRWHHSELVKSGKNPIRKDVCTHEDMQVRGLSRDILGHIATPTHCPFRKNEPRDTAGNFGHGSSGQFMRTQIDFDGR